MFEVSRVGSGGRVGSGRVGSGRVGSGRVGSGRGGSRAFLISRVGADHPDPSRPDLRRATRLVKGPNYHILRSILLSDRYDNTRQQLGVVKEVSESG